MASFTVTVPFTSLFPYDPLNPGQSYDVTVVCNPSGGGGTTLNNAAVGFLAGSIVRGEFGTLSFPNPNDTATVTPGPFNNSGISFGFNLELDSLPTNVDAVIVTFNLVLTIGSPSLKPGTFQIVPMVSVMIPPFSSSAVSQAQITCKGDTVAMQNPQPSVQQGSFAYPSSTDFSATVSSFTSAAFEPVPADHGLLWRESSITSKLLVNVTATTTTTPPASAGSAPVLISILF